MVAVLGMGRMGHALAGRLLEGGHEVIVWNRTKGKAKDLVEAGAREADTIAEATAAADVIITSLARDEAVREVALGDGGVRSNIRADSIYVDASTVSPRLSTELQAAFPRFVAMPIAGSPEAVQTGKATYLAGGDPGLVDSLAPLLASLSSVVRRYDEPRLAAGAKLANNLLLLTNLVALAEVFTVGRAAGLSDEQLRDYFADSPMVASGIKNRFEGVLTGLQKPWWTTELGAKDVGLAVDAAGEAGVELPVAVAVRDRYAEAASFGLADEDVAAVARLYRK